MDKPEDVQQDFSKVREVKVGQYYKFCLCSLPIVQDFLILKDLSNISHIFLSPLERNLSILTLFSTIDQRISSSQSEI
ncbi:hypothetical protein Avbf_01185 [Armadillidium vulgare]|nr:hypothetical protein Avbf_01185 [Armadillidium vulgare]